MKKGVVLNNFLPRISECFARFVFLPHNTEEETRPKKGLFMVTRQATARTDTGIYSTFSFLLQM